MYLLDIKPELDKKLEKIHKKNKSRFDIIMKKAEEILKNPHRYKNLRKPKQRLKRVHIDKHFVLVFLVDEKDKKVVLFDYNNHDKIYR